MNQMVAQQTGTAVGMPAGPDPYAAYARASGADNRPFLKCAKGDWVLGQDNTEVKTGTRFLANMADLSIGWLKWQEGKPVERKMGLLTEGFQPDRREDLGDLDEALWPLDPSSGKPADPWQFSNNLPLKFVDSDDECVFTASSKGGIGAVGKLCAAYGKEYRQRPGQVPIVEISTDSYMHSKKEYGRIKFPVLTIVGWVSEDEAAGDDPDAPAAPEAKPADAKKTTKPKF